MLTLMLAQHAELMLAGVILVKVTHLELVSFLWTHITNISRELKNPESTGKEDYQMNKIGFPSLILELKR